MTHLTFHLVDELDIYGPIICCWIYSIEQALKDLKRFVQNMCKPKGSMVDGYIFDEALGLCTKYMEAFIAIKRRVQDANEEGVAGEVLDGVPKT